MPAKELYSLSSGSFTASCSVLSRAARLGACVFAGSTVTSKRLMIDMYFSSVLLVTSSPSSKASLARCDRDCGNINNQISRSPMHSCRLLLHSIARTSNIILSTRLLLMLSLSTSILADDAIEDFWLLPKEGVERIRLQQVQKDYIR